MSVRAAGLAVIIGIVLIGSPRAAEDSTASAPASRAVNDFPVASEVRLGGDETQTRLVVDLSQKIDLRVFTLANPYRVVIDLPQVTFQVPARTGDRGRGLIKAFRFGLVMPGGSRMVLDLAKPARIDKAFVLEPANDQPARLVLELAAVEHETFMRTLALDTRTADAAPTRKLEAEPEVKSGDARPVIVIDPGHGGIDHGTRSAPTGDTEKALVLEFAQLLREKVEKSGKYRVVMTRTDDHFVALAERVNFARARHASLFISIHADALPRGEGEAHGATIYTLSETASDAAAARLAENENRADVIAGLDLTAEPSDVADILIDLARRETKSFSTQFARGLMGQLKSAVRLHKEPLKSAGFRVLRAPDVPSVLLELGYVSNKQDLQALTSPAWRTRTAETIAQAVDAFFSTRLAGGRN